METKFLPHRRTRNLSHDDHDDVDTHDPHDHHDMKTHAISVPPKFELFLCVLSPVTGVSAV